MKLRREFELFGIGFSVLWKHAGLVTIWLHDWTIHFGVHRSSRLWGHHITRFQGFEFHDWGLGPFLLVCRM